MEYFKTQNVFQKALIHKSKCEVWPFNYISNFKVRAMHRKHMIKNAMHLSLKNCL